MERGDGDKSEGTETMANLLSSGILLQTQEYPTNDSVVRRLSLETGGAPTGSE